MKKRDIRKELDKLAKEADRTKRRIEKLVAQYQELVGLIEAGTAALNAEAKPAEVPAPETVPASVLKGIEEAAAGELEDGPKEPADAPVPEVA